MKEGFDKEIDALLRRSPRPWAGVPAGGGNGPGEPGGGAHLDADELSAFAEGALPAAARVAAVSHLADCDECRGAAVSLARVSGFEVASEKRAAAVVTTAAVTTAAASQAGWRAWLAALFAPRVLRYAAPALALCVVGVVSYVALRTRQGAEREAPQTAMLERPQAEAAKEPAGVAPSANTAMNMNTSAEGLTAAAPGDGARNSSAAGSSAQPSVGGGHGAAEVPPVSPPEDVAAVTAPPPPAPAKAVAEAGPAQVASAAPADAPAESRDAAAEEKKEKDARRDEVAQDYSVNEQLSQQRRANQSRAGEVQMPDGSRNRGGYNNQPGAVGGNAGTAPAPRGEEREGAVMRESEARRTRPAAPARRRATAEDGDETARAEETRSAAGHRFRREGGAWVDVNYKPSMPSTGVRRGSEAYRALVADLPEIGRAAQQLGGEVVVVVRGRAYRIR